MAKTALPRQVVSCEVTAPASDDTRGDLFDPACPTRELLDRIGSKWTSMAGQGARRGRAAGDPVRRAAAQDARGIAEDARDDAAAPWFATGCRPRRVEPAVPPRVHYSLTPLGLSLDEPLAALRAWAEEHMAEIGRANRDADAAGGDRGP